MTEARDALAVALASTWEDITTEWSDEQTADAILAALPDGWVLARRQDAEDGAALREGLEFAAAELLGLARSGWSYPAERQAIATARLLRDVLDGRRKATHEWVSGGGLSSWMGEPEDAPCMRCGKHRTASCHISIAATTRPTR
jgi:hypothetical protein